MVNNVLELLKNKDFSSILDNYLLKSHIGVGESVSPRFKSYSEQLKRPRYIMPVVGVQGSGKSTLLNAVLFKKRVLPTDSDETTCVPTEIMYGNNKNPVATVYYNNGVSEEIECSASGLKPFVHQEDNPGNIKEVEKIVIEMEHPILKMGLVLVDLPGYGSLTPNNVAKFKEYMQNDIGAIFLFYRINQSDVVEIQALLPGRSKIFFIQNAWEKDPEKDIDKLIKEHRRLLKEAFKRIKKPDKGLDILPVNIEKALNSAMEKDSTGLQESKLPDFENRLTDFSQRWKEDILNAVKTDLTELSYFAIKAIDDKVEFIQKDEAKFYKEIEEEREKFLKEFDNKKNLIDSCCNRMEEQVKEIKKRVYEECRVEANSFRRSMREIVDSGITGGSQLSRAFSDIQSEHSSNIFEKIQPDIIDMIFTTEQNIRNIGSFSFDTPELPKLSVPKTKDPKFPDKDKRGGLAERGLVIAGTIAGVVLGERIAKKLAAKLPVDPATKLAIIIGITLAGKLVGSFLGSKVREKRELSEGEKAKRRISSLINKFEREIEQQYVDMLENELKNIRNKSEDWLLLKKEEFNNKVKDIEKDMLKKGSEKEQVLEKLTKERKALKDFLGNIKRLEESSGQN